MFKFFDTIAKRNSRGYLVSVQAQATFYDAGTSDLATIYADDGVTELPNPLTADSDGLIEARLPNGSYDVEFHDGVSSKLIEGITANDGSLTASPQEITGTQTGVVVCSTPFPIDGSIPQNTEGTEVCSVSITPQDAASELEISFFATGTTSTGMFIGAGVFVGTDADAIAGSVAMEQTTGAKQKFQMAWSCRVPAGSTSARTYKLRLGPGSSGTAYVNGDEAGVALFGGTAKATITVREVLPA